MVEIHSSFVFYGCGDVLRKGGKVCGSSIVGSFCFDGYVFREEVHLLLFQKLWRAKIALLDDIAVARIFVWRANS